MATSVTLFFPPSFHLKLNRMGTVSIFSSNAGGSAFFSVFFFGLLFADGAGFGASGTNHAGMNWSLVGVLCMDPST